MNRVFGMCAVQGTARERGTGKQLQMSVVARIQRFAASSSIKRSVLRVSDQSWSRITLVGSTRIDGRTRAIPTSSSAISQVYNIFSQLSSLVTRALQPDLLSSALCLK